MVPKTASRYRMKSKAPHTVVAAISDDVMAQMPVSAKTFVNCSIWDAIRRAFRPDREKTGE